MELLRSSTTRTIQRDRLAGLLREEVAKFPEQVTLRYNTELANVEWATEGVLWLAGVAAW